MRYQLITLFAVAGLLSQGAADAADKIDATFKFYWNGFLVSEANTAAEIAPEDYDFTIDFRMRGVAKLFANGRSAVRAQGRWDEGAPVPSLYSTEGRWDGKDFAKTLTFDAAGAMADQQLDWPKKWLEEFKREPVPGEMQVGPDPASLVVQMVRQPIAAAVADGGLTGRAFDGDSVFEYDLSCLSDPVELEPSKRSPFSGEAYECTFGGRLVAGERILTEKQKTKAEKERRKIEKKRAKGKYEEPTPPKLWVQVFEDGAYALPVRAEVSTGMGRVRMYLTELDLSAAATAATAPATRSGPETSEN